MAIRTKSKNPKKSGRKPIPIDWKTVDSLLEAGCSGIQVAGYLNINQETLYDAVVREKKMSFTDYSVKNRAKGDSLLLAKQFESAIKDKNISMQIWLGKQRLNQADKREVDLKTDGIKKTVNDFFPEEGVKEYFNGSKDTKKP